MQPSMVVEVEIAADPTSRLFRIDAVVQLDLFVPECAPRLVAGNLAAGELERKP